MIDNAPKTASELILYQTEDGRTRIEYRFEGDTLWLTQALIAELFQTTPQNITLHLKDLFAEGEILEEATCKEHLQVRREGQRQVTRSLRHYAAAAAEPTAFGQGIGMTDKNARRPGQLSPKR